MKGTSKYYVLYKCASRAGFVGYTQEINSQYCILIFRLLILYYYTHYIIILVQISPDFNITHCLIYSKGPLQIIYYYWVRNMGIYFVD